MPKPRYDEQEDKSRHAATDDECCYEMERNYGWKLVDIEETGDSTLEVDCVFEGKTEFPDWYKEQERKEDK